MSTRIPAAFYATILALTAASATAEIHPVLDRGFSPENVYQVGEIDAVNTFNGGLGLTLPLGQSYPVGGRLGYQLVLHYNSSLWERSLPRDQSACDPDAPGVCRGRKAVPSRFDNAGAGWRLSLGDLVAPFSIGENRPRSWMYVAPDGSQHLFVDTLHEGDPVHENVWYTRDNTYMRLSVLKVGGAGNPVWMKLEDADGTQRIFTRTGQEWRLWKIRDTFANHVDIKYEEDLWTIVDSVGRTHRVHWKTVAGRSVVRRVELAAFGGRTARYVFHYAGGASGVEIEQNCIDAYSGTPDEMAVPLLTSLTLPDGSAYRMTTLTGHPAYHRENGRDVNDCVPLSGILHRLTVPTGGVYDWTFGLVRYPNATSACTAERDGALTPSFTTRAGVTRRRVFHDALESATWSYQYPFSSPSTHRVRRIVTSPEGDDTVHFFNTERCPYQNGVRVGWEGWAYGLPFAPGSGSGPFRSVEYYEGRADPHNLRRVRSVRYEHDQLPELTEPGPKSWYESNRRLAETQVLYYGVDVDVRDEPLLVLQSSARTKRKSFDGLGHYRRVERSGFGAAHPRVEVTRYNPGRGTYSVDAGNRPTGSFTMLPPDEPWVLDTFDLATQAEGSAVAKQEFCFDVGNGLLLRARALRSGTARDSRDLVSRFTHDIRGNLRGEYFYGGDRRPIGTGSLCTLGLSTPDYGLVHEHQYGSLRRTTHDGTSVRSFDADIDLRTGLVSRSRDVSGLATDWRYDELGRVTVIEPDEGARVDLTYSGASGDAQSGQFEGASLHTTFSSTTGQGALAQEESEVDALGRLVAERRLLPDGTWAERQVGYTRGGQVAEESEWAVEGATAAWTSYSDHDPFGRARQVTTPDGHVTSFAFEGDRASTRTVSVGTTGRGRDVSETPFSARTERDHLGRVIAVVEPIASSQDVTSTYEYDVGGRLTRATILAPEGTQTREFSFDNRGFLQWHSMPEKGGAEGNGRVTFGDYDARGHAWSVTNGPNRLAFTFDAAERLTGVREATGARRLLEERDYGSLSRYGNWSKGKLTRAVRHNYFDGAQDLRVQEDYTYEGLGGRVSRRTTVAGVVGTDRDSTFVQGFTWNGLGALLREDYPRLGSVGPTRAVEYRYTNGLLTSVPGFVNSIRYHPNGMTWRAIHSNGVMDEQTLDSSGMARPHKIRSRYASKNWSSGTYRYDGAGSIVGMGGDWFLYDGLSRLTEGTTKRADGRRGRQRYWYDGFGNLTRIWTGGQGSRYFDVSSATNRLTSSAYDTAGNQTTWGSGPLTYRYTYSPFNQIHTLSGGSPATVRYYGYTADGERITSYASDTDTVTFALRNLGGRVVREFDQISLTGASSWKKDYIWGSDGLVATVSADGETRHFHLDHLGSPRLVTDTDRVEVARHNYYPFGEEATNPFLDDERMKFTGHERDLNLDGQTTDDLDYMHARYFNPNLGRFLTVDPVGGRIGLSQSWNRYTYVLDDPVNLLDPRGLDGRRVFHGEITVTARAPRNPFLWILFPPYTPAQPNQGRLRGGRVGSGGDLVQAIGDRLNVNSDLPPCSENFREAYLRSLKQANLGHSLPELAGFTASKWLGGFFVGGHFVAAEGGLISPFSALAQSSRISALARIAGWGSAFRAGRVGATKVGAAFLGGQLFGTVLNIQIVEMIQNPCQRSW